MNRAFNISPNVRLVPAGDFFTTLPDEESPQLWPTSGVARLWQLRFGPNFDEVSFAFFAKKRANRKEIVDLCYELRERYFCYDSDSYSPMDTRRYYDAMIKICGSSNVPSFWS